MKTGTLNSLIAACAISALAAPAWADCQQELAELKDQVEAGAEGGISKDGSLAPLEGDDSAASGTSSDMSADSDQTGSASGEGEVAKDGSETPLDADTAGVATSSQDAEAQQNDASSALAEKGPETVSQESQAALARAEAALEAGDEAGCMEAVEEARSL